MFAQKRRSLRRALAEAMACAYARGPRSPGAPRGSQKQKVLDLGWPLATSRCTNLHRRSQEGVEFVSPPGKL